MADTKISAAVDIVSLVGTDMLPVARSGSATAYHATMTEIGAFTVSSQPIATTTTLGDVKVDGTTITVDPDGTLHGPAATLSLPLADGTAQVGTNAAWSPGDHRHPTDTSRAPLASPTFTGTPSLPTGTTGVTQTAGTNNTSLATTAFVATSFAPLASPALTGSPTVPTAAAGTNTTQAASTAFVTAATATALNDAGRNFIHNGRFNVQQRGAGPWTTNGFTADRWLVGVVTDTISFSVASLADADRAAIGDESATSALQNTFTGSSSAGAYNEIWHTFENVRRLSNRTVTVSLWAKAASGTPKIGLNLGQVFGTGGSPSGAVFLSGQALTLSTVWTRYTATFTLPSVSGKTLGTNNDHATRVEIWYSDQGTYSSRSGGIGVQSGTINIWGVQLEIGSVATPLETIDPVRDLQQCQRFYQVGGSGWWGYGAASSNVGLMVNFPTAMRAAPTVVLSGQGYINASAATPSSATTGGFYLTATATAAGAVAMTTNYTASADL